MKIAYIAPYRDASGYALAARNNIGALHKVGVPLSVVPISFESKKTDTGKLGKICDALQGSTDGCNIQIIHATPPNIPRLIDRSKYNIGYVAWETSKLPPDWVGLINQLDEVWVPSIYNVHVFQDSGIKIPVIHIPHPMSSLEEERVNTDNRYILGIGDEDFVFYSIFQWLERKNPSGLLKAYLTEFEAEEKVCLVMKTFRILPGMAQDEDIIREQVGTFKSKMYLSSYPKILLISNILSNAEMNALHNRGDCLVTLNRAEGFGLTITEAMRAGKPVIATNYGGPVDFLKQAGGYLVPYQLTPVCGMPWEMYQADQLWAEPDVYTARQLMRQVYTNREEAKTRGLKGREWVKQYLSHEAIGQIMKGRLEAIKR